jgi:hypothetical protein
MIEPGGLDRVTTDAPPAARAAGDVADDLPGIAPELGAVADEDERRHRQPVPWVSVCRDRDRLRPDAIWRDPPTNGASFVRIPETAALPPPPGTRGPYRSGFGLGLPIV